MNVCDCSTIISIIITIKDNQESKTINHSYKKHSQHTTFTHDDEEELCRLYLLNNHNIWWKIKEGSVYRDQTVSVHLQRLNTLF